MPMLNEWDGRVGGMWWDRLGQSREVVNTGGLIQEVNTGVLRDTMI